MYDGFFVILSEYKCHITMVTLMSSSFNATSRAAKMHSQQLTATHINSQQLTATHSNSQQHDNYGDAMVVCSLEHWKRTSRIGQQRSKRLPLFMAMTDS
jgi:hypothetical protein